MATVTKRVCDRCEVELSASENVVFDYDGARYTAEWCRACFDIYDDEMTKFVGGAVEAYDPRSAPKVRAWAKENGYTVKPRGRLTTEVLNAYRESQA